MSWMIIRVRGTIHAKEDIRTTLAELHLTRPNHATVVPESPDYRGMLTKVQGYVTWGEAEAATVKLLLEQRGRPREAPSPAATPAAPQAPDYAELAQQVVAEGLPRQRVVQPLFRLRAPKGGWRSTKKPFALGGALGYRGVHINTLAQRML
ncbi:MAG: 50S ribosomal protein L30 [Thermoplasmata archaeon]|nr:50S ribosomal protein L30 [Thermoplasmata archaeon]MCI4341969.1 50S ribosomal protein L30 [Thermoplasmata archaeon]